MITTEEKIKKTEKKIKKPQTAKRVTYVTIKLTETEKEQLKQQAYEIGLDISEYVRLKLFDRLRS